MTITRLIRQERNRQDVQWGGKRHDDTHTVYEWIRFIEHQLDGCANAVDAAEYESRMVKVAALAVAAIESQRRINSKAVSRCSLALMFELGQRWERSEQMRREFGDGVPE